MNSTRASTALLAVAFACAPALAQITPGQTAPEIKIEQLFNAEAPFSTLAELRGSAVMLEFWATWCGPCRAQIPHVNELHAKYGERGLMVVGMTNEPEGKVKPFLETSGQKYAIGIDTTSAAMKWYGVNGIPHAFLIDKDGKVSWSGHPASLTDADIDKVLVGAMAYGKLTDQLEPVQMLIDKGQHGRALTTLLAMQRGGKLEGKSKEQATRAIARLEGAAKSALERAATLAKTDNQFDAAITLQTTASLFEGSEPGTACKAQLDAFAATDAGKKALALAVRVDKGRRLVAEKKYEAAYAEYQAVAAGGDAAAEALAKKAMAEIDNKGMRGFHADCPVCRLRGTACAEHKPK